MADPVIERPIFVIGTGRSGLSPLMDLISYHPLLAWPSQYHHRMPNRPALATKLSRLVDAPLIGRALRFRKGAPEHSEAWPMWHSLFPGFVEPSRDLTAADVTPLIRRQFRTRVAQIVADQGKRRFIAELSGWSRVGFLREIFPDAQFVHIVRDGRAVANSLTNVEYWRGWRGVQNWRWGPLPAELEKAFEATGRSFLALAGLQWKILVRNIVDQTGKLAEADHKLVRYEDLVKDPGPIALDVARFCGLDLEASGFRAHVDTVASTRILNANTTTMRIPSWRKNMSDDQVAMLDDLLGDELRLFGYL